MPTYTVGFGTFASSGGGTTPWKNIANVAIQDSVFATTNGMVGGTAVTQYLQCTAPVGLTLPANEFVNAIGFTIWRLASNSSATGVTDLHIYPIKGGVVQSGATDLADTVTLWPIANTARTYGGVDTLGLSWLNSDFGAGFGVAIDVSLFDPLVIGIVPSIDYISCTLTTIVLGAGGLRKDSKTLHPDLARIPGHTVREL